MKKVEKCFPETIYGTRHIPVNFSCPSDLVKRLDWLVDMWQLRDPAMSRSAVMARFLHEKLDEYKVPHDIET